MKAYIINSKVISAQQTFGKEFPPEIINSPKLRMSAIEPEYKQFINPMKLRRMSRVVKMGVASSLQCLKESRVEQPGAIITTTGWGCLADTFKLLNEIGENQEETLSPSTFIQSTHNTVGGQIALLLGCQEYNSVYVNDSSSFEHGLLDAMLLLEEGKESVLIGGLDEITETDFSLKEQAGWWKTEIDTPHIAQSNSSGTIAGEGSAFFLLSNNPDNRASSCIRAVKLALGNNPVEALAELLSEHELSPGKIDIVISGINGDNRTNSVYLDFIHSNLDSAGHCYYKHLTGDFDSASAFALWLADQIIRTQNVPEYLKISKESEGVQSINQILIHHFKQPSEHAFILVSKAGL
jgi:3-oxoacyl-[acyl-carrier-protein] synthase II